MKPCYTASRAAPNGSFPYAGVVRDSAGNLYGTTQSGGISTAACTGGCGVVFKLDPAGHETVLHAFTGFTDGADPVAGVILDAAGNLYGTTMKGGAGNGGIVYRLDTSGQEIVLHSFCAANPRRCKDGAMPESGLIPDSHGAFYGTTTSGGPSGAAGVVYKVDAAGHYQVFYAFGASGYEPAGGVIRDSFGNFYGTTSSGGTSNAGVVYELDTAGNQTVLYTFTGAGDGGNPTASLVRDLAGNLYGTTSKGGANNEGVVYKVDMSGQETVLHTFTGGSDGGYPYAGVILDSAGNLYGTASSGGSTRLGVAFKLDASGQERVLRTFPAGTGCAPFAGVIVSGGSLYGTTYNGGSANAGTVYKLSAGQHKVLYSFSGGTDGGYPYTSVVGDAAGNLYGTTFAGGAFNAGTVYKLDPSGKETVLYSFPDGAGDPYGGVILDAAGNLYGTTVQGGPYDSGTVYKLDPSGQFTLLHVFQPSLQDLNDGSEPYAGLALDSNGNLYGTTLAGGGGGDGVAFEVSAAGVYAVIYSFGLHGSAPYGPLVLDSAGNLYGTASSGGNASAGVVYKLDSSHTETVLYNFTGGADGGHPLSGLTFDSSGNLYGTTYSGGTSGQGVVYKLDTFGQETVLHEFTGGLDGSGPYAGVVINAAGTIFGTAPYGGKLSGGVVFQVQP